MVDLARGERLVTLALPDNHRWVHTTALGAYIVAKDEDDLAPVLLYRRPFGR